MSADLDLTSLPPHAWRFILDIIEAERADAFRKGMDAQRARMLAELRAETGALPLDHEGQQALARRLAGAVDFPTLLERRGRDDEAQQVRADYVRRGIIPGATT